jgi:hypothetical protein
MRNGKRIEEVIRKNGDWHRLGATGKAQRQAVSLDLGQHVESPTNTSTASSGVDEKGSTS